MIQCDSDKYMEEKNIVSKVLGSSTLPICTPTEATVLTLPPSLLVLLVSKVCVSKVVKAG